MISHSIKKAYIQAKKLSIQAISVIENSETPEHSDLFAALHSYGTLLLLLGKREKALKLIQRAETIERKTPGQ